MSRLPSGLPCKGGLKKCRCGEGKGDSSIVSAGKNVARVLGHKLKRYVSIIPSPLSQNGGGVVVRRYGGARGRWQY